MDENAHLTVLATARTITGMIRALELHADAVPHKSHMLRINADELRGERDALLEAFGIPLEEAADSDGYGSSHEWAGAFSRLKDDAVVWRQNPSQDPWSPRR
ncbi:hypothetical protein [Nonomuraea sp. NPDC049709]|uniref:hypothetical protein n=1 Tax=Nonomuraea sp. NPDC049709 TaxID=3154736 RepID=UPI003429FD4A